MIFGKGHGGYLSIVGGFSENIRKVKPLWLEIYTSTMCTPKRKKSRHLILIKKWRAISLLFSFAVSD